MDRKIEWYQEVLSLEPGSKVFFPLAQLFVETGHLDDAVITLTQGLDRHPDFLEARMLLVQLLSELGREGEVHEHLKRVVEPLSSYPAFWRAWAKSMPEEKRDVAVFLMLVASNLSGDEIGWTDVVFEGMSSLSDRLVGEPLPAPSKSAVRPAPLRMVSEKSTDHAKELDGAVKTAGSGGTGTFRTRTMADLLASQGDIEGAIAIYEELLESRPVEEHPILQGRLDELRGHAVTTSSLDSEDPFGVLAKNRLIGTLETLAARFEARVRS